MILLIDNYDSFSYNLYQLIGSVEPDILVIRNDAATVDEVASMGAEAIVLSPGPGRPSEAGICEDVVRQLSGTVPILGVCLGHQAICEALGGIIIHAQKLMHGKASMADLNPSCELFKGIPFPSQVGRYHSLEADPDTLPPCLRVTASTATGEVMAVEHVSHPTFGLQFHPESVLTPAGPTIARNFVDIARRFATPRP